MVTTVLGHSSRHSPPLSVAHSIIPFVDIRTAPTLEQLVNGYIYRALLSPEHLEEVTAAFGGLDLRSSAAGKFDRVQLAHAIAGKVLGAGWYYDVIEDTLADWPRVRIVITGRS